MAKKKIEFETALSRLQEIITEMEKKNIQISKSIDLFEEGIELSDYCSKYLKKAELKVTKLVRKNDKFLETELDIEENS